ncbi:MerR family DNA-binding transcriptional regulator [Streptomyces sp. NPDC054838]
MRIDGPPHPEPEGLALGSVRVPGTSDLARQVKMRLSALRYYESIGLRPTARRVTGRRLYWAGILRRFALIAMRSGPDSP